MIRQDKKIQRYCSEPIESIENYDKAIADKENLWDCHHRLEVQGEFTNSKELLIRCGMYWHVPASQLIFLRHDAHCRLHKMGKNNPNFGKPRSEETKRKMAISNRGQKRSEETRRKISEARRRYCQSKNEISV